MLLVYKISQKLPASVSTDLIPIVGMLDYLLESLRFDIIRSLFQTLFKLRI